MHLQDVHLTLYSSSYLKKQAPASNLRGNYR